MTTKGRHNAAAAVALPRTIGEVLYADKSRPIVSEEEWAGLLQCIAARDYVSLYSLYAASHRIVFTLAMRQLNDADSAEEATLDVFNEVWRRAIEFDGARHSVAGWLMDLTRTRATSMAQPEPAWSRSMPSHMDVLNPSAMLLNRLVWQIGYEMGQILRVPKGKKDREWKWKEVAPGISCDLLSTDTARQRVSLMVRLAPGIDYPPHRHAGLEELYLLHGELMINDKKLFPGDYNRAEPDTVDHRVWSETGCTCVLITSTEDELLNASGKK